MTQVAGKSYNFKDLAHFVDDIKFLLTRGGDGNVGQSETATKKILGWIVFVLLIGVIIYALYLVYRMVFGGYSRTLRDFFTMSFSHQEDTLQVVGAEQGQFYKALVGLHDNKLNQAFAILEQNGYPVSAGDCNGEDCGNVFDNLFNTIDNYYEPEYGSEKNMKALTDYYIYYSHIFKPFSLGTIGVEERISKLTQMIETLYNYEELYNNILDIEVRKICFANTGKEERERLGNEDNKKQLEAEFDQLKKQYNIHVVTTGKEFASYYTSPLYIARCGAKSLKQFYDEVLKNTPHESLRKEVQSINNDIQIAYRTLKNTLPEGIDEQKAKIKFLRETKLNKEILMAKYRKMAQEQATEQYKQQATEVLVDIKKKKKKPLDKVEKAFKNFGKSFEKKGKKTTLEAQRKLSNFGKKTGDDITNAGLKIKDGVTNAASDVKAGVTNFGLDVRDKMKDFGNETDYAFKKFGQDSKKGLTKFGQDISVAFGGKKKKRHTDDERNKLQKPEKSRHEREKSQHTHSQRQVTQLEGRSQAKGSKEEVGGKLPISNQDVPEAKFDKNKALIDIIQYEEDKISPILEKREDGKQNKIYVPCYDLYHQYVIMNKNEQFKDTSMSDEELVAYVFMKDYQMIQNRPSKDDQQVNQPVKDDVKAIPILERILRMQIAMEKVAKMTSYSVGMNSNVRNLLYYIFMTDDSTLDDAKDNVITNEPKITFAYQENKFDIITVSNDYSWYIMELFYMLTSTKSSIFDSYFSQLLALNTSISIEKMQTLNVYLNINKKPPDFMENLQLEPALVQFAIHHPIFTSIYLSQVVSIDTRSLNTAAIDAKLKNAYDASSKIYAEITSWISQLTPVSAYGSAGSIIDALKTNLHNLKEAFIYMHIVHLYLTEYKTTSGLKERVREDRLVREGFVELIEDQRITEKEFFMRLILPFKNDLIDMRVVGAWKDLFYSDRFKHNSTISYWRDFKAYWIDYLRPTAEKTVLKVWRDVGKTAKLRFK